MNTQRNILIIVIPILLMSIQIKAGNQKDLLFCHRSSSLEAAAACDGCLERKTTLDPFKNIRAIEAFDKGLKERMKPKDYCESLKLKEDLSTARSRFKKEKSCEAQYYDLFLNERPSSIASSALLTDTTKVISNTKELYKGVLAKYPPYDKDPRLQKDFISRLEQTKVVITSNPNVDMGLLVKSYDCDNPPCLAESTMYLSKENIEKYGDVFAVWALGHEYNHNMNWSSPDLIKCLSSLKSIEAVTKESSPLSDKSIPGDFGGGWSEGSGTGYIKPFEKLYELSPKFAENFLLIWQSNASDTQKRIMIQEELKKEPSPKELRDTMKIFRGALQLGSGKLPTQVDEMTSDYLASLVVAEYIKSHYKEGERKKALESLLKAFPPNLYTPRANTLMSQISAKPPNENRVLKILLANPDIRDILGCEFETLKPTFCK